VVQCALPQTNVGTKASVLAAVQEAQHFLVEPFATQRMRASVDDDQLAPFVREASSLKNAVASTCLHCPSIPA